MADDVIDSMLDGLHELDMRELRDEISRLKARVSNLEAFSRSELPRYCLSCGVPLIGGGATKHEPRCSIVAMIAEHFGPAFAKRVTKQ